jgi:hypothetical protein
MTRHNSSHVETAGGEPLAYVTLLPEDADAALSPRSERRAVSDGRSALSPTISSWRSGRGGPRPDQRSPTHCETGSGGSSSPTIPHGFSWPGVSSSPSQQGSCWLGAVRYSVPPSWRQSLLSPSLRSAASASDGAAGPWRFCQSRTPFALPNVAALVALLWLPQWQPGMLPRATWTVSQRTIRTTVGRAMRAAQRFAHRSIGSDQD